VREPGVRIGESVRVRKSVAQIAPDRAVIGVVRERRGVVGAK
jgi:hypothetical protein